MNKELLNDSLNKVIIDWKIHDNELKVIRKFYNSISKFCKLIIPVS